MIVNQLLIHTLISNIPVLLFNFFIILGPVLSYTLHLVIEAINEVEVAEIDSKLFSELISSVSSL